MVARNSVILVDEHDNQIGIEDKIIAHQKGLLHRAFSVMFYRYNNGKLEFLLQQRAEGKYHCGGLWTNTCCSHPQASDILEKSAANRLLEELEDIDLTLVVLQSINNFIYKASFNNGLTEYEYDHVLIAEYNHTPKFFNKLEVQALQWYSLKDIEQQYVKNKNNFTPWFYKVYTICKDYLIA
jgi:isopentenyl-diphosphate delta-isomerase